MKFYVIWRSSLKSIFKNRRRSFLTMFGIIIGIASVIAIMAVGRGFEKQTVESLTQGDGEEITTNIQFEPDDDSLFNSNIDLITESDLALMKNVNGVTDATYYETGTQSNLNVEIEGKVQAKVLETINSTSKEMLVGRNLTKQDNQINNKVVVIDEELAEGLFNTVENALGKGLEVNGEVFNIVGVFPNVSESIFAYNSNVYVPVDTYEHFFGEDRITYLVTITLRSGASLDEVANNVVNNLNDYGENKNIGKYSVYDMSALTEGISTVMSTITLFVSAVAGISLFIAGVGVMNMMYISVSERTKEIGIRRALGANQQSIRLQFLLEGISLTLVGGIIGYILGMILAVLVGSLIDVTISVDVFTIGLAVGISTLIGLVFSVVPASNAAKKDLIDILK